MWLRPTLIVVLVVGTGITLRAAVLSLAAVRLTITVSSFRLDLTKLLGCLFYTPRTGTTAFEFLPPNGSHSRNATPRKASTHDPACLLPLHAAPNANVITPLPSPSANRINPPSPPPSFPRSLTSSAISVPTAADHAAARIVHSSSSASYVYLCPA
ncbi:hypothetical protein BDQ17DRAFT_1355706 [Cyathus striatus]|nr:hypothetical protein BDQ17DRAFT_1355706 [Cyathus striatus]